jgi:hypothetical protein
MAGLVLLLVIVLWAVVSLWLCYLATRSIPNLVGKVMVYLVAVPTVFFAPVCDEYLGQRQFEHVCEGAEDVRILGRIPVGTEFYTSEGAWRLGKNPRPDWDGYTRLVVQADSLVRWDHGETVPGTGLIPIGQRHSKIYNKANGQLIAEWTAYSFPGGFLRRNVWPAGHECQPPLMRRGGYPLYERLMPFQP